MVSGKWPQWPVASGQWPVASGKWQAASDEECTLLRIRLYIDSGTYSVYTEKFKMITTESKECLFGDSTGVYLKHAFKNVRA